MSPIGLSGNGMQSRLKLQQSLSFGGRITHHDCALPPDRLGGEVLCYLHLPLLREPRPRITLVIGGSIGLITVKRMAHFDWVD
jgi:hypothetical protein